MKNWLGKMTTKSGKGLLGYAVDTIVSLTTTTEISWWPNKSLGRAAWHRLPVLRKEFTAIEKLWYKKDNSTEHMYRWLGWENTSWDKNFGPPVPAKSFASITLLIMMKLMASIIKLV